MKNYALLLICFCVMLNGCTLVKEKAAEGVTAKVRDTIATQLPEDKRDAFTAKWDAGDTKGATVLAVEAVGADKFADIIENIKTDNEELRAQNAELAADIRERGVDAVKERWASIAVALSTTLLGLFGLKRGSKWYSVASTIIGGVQGFLKAGQEGNAELMAHIKSEAILNSNKAEVDAAVGKVLKAKGETPIVNVKAAA
jgi:hypothetical protein